MISTAYLSRGTCLPSRLCPRFEKGARGLPMITVDLGNEIAAELRKGGPLKGIAGIAPTIRARAADTDLRELLPRDSPGLQAFERQLARVGGGATLLVVVESPNTAENHRFIDELAGRLDVMMSAGDYSAHRLIGFVESNAKDVRGFFEDNKWLYADKSDLDRAYDALDFQIAVRSGPHFSDLHAQPGPGAGGGPADPQKPALGDGALAEERRRNQA